MSIRKTFQTKAAAPGGRAVVSDFNDLTGVIEFSEAPQSVRERFFASLPNGADYRSRTGMAAAPAWVASRVYGEGSIVQNGGNEYLNIGPFGAAAGSGGPSGTGNGPITDGATKWLYIGPVTPAKLDDSDLPTITFAATPGSCTRQYQAQSVSDMAAAFLSGANYTNTNVWGGAPAIVATGSESFQIDFMTDAPIVAINSFGNYPDNASDQEAINPMINGKPVFRMGGVRAGTDVTPGGPILDFSTKPRKARRIRYTIGGRGFTGIGIAPEYKIWPPVNPHRWRLAVEGDSTAEGSDPANSVRSDVRAIRLANMLGCDDVWSFAVGGSGFIAASGGGSTVLNRAPSVIAARPNMLYVAPINNDVGNDATYNSTTRKAAYKLYFDTILAGLPNCIIICGGGYGTGSNNISTAADSAYQVDLDMRDAIAEYNHQHVKFLPSITGADGRWLEGNGHVGSAGSTPGNADRFIGDGVDTLHPNQRYLEYVMWREYYGIVQIMNGIN